MTYGQEQISRCICWSFDRQDSFCYTILRQDLILSTGSFDIVDRAHLSGSARYRSTEEEAAGAEKPRDYEQF